MKVIAVVLFLLLVILISAVACDGEDAAPGAPMSPDTTPGGPAAGEPATEASQNTPEPTEPPPTAASTATAIPPSTNPGPASTSTSAPRAVATPEVTPTPVPDEATEPTVAASGTGPDSFSVGEGSQITFTVEEETDFAPVRFDAVVSGTGLTGYANLDGSPSVITLDLHSLESDQRFRDRYIRQRMFPDTPTATVTFDQLPDLPQGFFDGEETEGMLDGSLQIGETVTPLTFDVIARHDGTVINVLGKTTFTWDELGLAKPVFGPVTYLAEEVRVQVLIVAHEQ